jgi:hypothetical protein
MEIKSTYFDIRTFISQSDNGAWIGRIRSYRKDTGENWYYGKTIIAKSQQELELKLDDEKIKLYPLLDIPYDWEQKSRKILVRYLRLAEETTRFSSLFLTDDNDHSKVDNVKDKYFELCGFLIDESIFIVGEISALSEEDRCELILSRDHIFSDPTNPWNLDDLSGRLEIFKFFLNPSEKEKDLHEKHRKCLEAALSNQ